MSVRNYIRHPTDIPIEVRRDAQPDGSGPLCDVSRGGLSFRHPVALAPGEPVRVRIALVSPPFEADCRVAWCRADADGFQVGVEFLHPEDLYRLRMVEQICHIEHYRRELREREGRQLSGHEAALEWIEKYAPSFPLPEEPGGDPDKPH